MIMYISLTSPYARKARIVAEIKGLTSKIEEIIVNAHTDPEELIAVNPLSKIPTLVLDSGTSIFDSNVIAQYLDNLSSENILHTKTDNDNSISISVIRSLSDAITDQMVNIVMEKNRPETEQSAKMINRWNEKINRSLQFIENNIVAELGVSIDIGQISLLCALDFGEFRKVITNLHTDFPKLAEWKNTISAQDFAINTYPRV